MKISTVSMYLQIYVHCFADLSAILVALGFSKFWRKLMQILMIFADIHMYIYIPLAPRSATKGHFRVNVWAPPPKWATTCNAYPSIFRGDPTNWAHEKFS